MKCTSCFGSLLGAGGGDDDAAWGCGGGFASSF